MTIHYRPGTSDEDALREVVLEKCYARPGLGFDVMPGETWLDLGANIGAFAIYCQLRGAMAECFEPDPDCFKLLQMNAAVFPLHQSAITNSRASSLPFKKSPNPSNHWRGTALPVGDLADHPAGALPNTYAGALRGRRFDGVKMDIEGSEFGLIDDDLLPVCDKLVLEYHFSRSGRRLAPFYERIAHLCALFVNVQYPDSIDADRGATGFYSGRHDPLVFAWGALP